MTIHQLRVAIEASRGGSISYAAERLQISQPNASNNIKSLEAELGFPIFIRRGSGVELTEKGYDLIEHAERIVNESDEISLMGERNPVFRLHLGVMNYSPAIDAYLRLCAGARACPRADLSYITTSPNDAVRLLRDREMDIAAILYMNEYIPVVEKLCHENRLEIVPVSRVSYNVNFRKGHPLDLRGDFMNSPEDLELLKDYPYVDYSRLSTVVGPMNGESESKIPYKYKIFVDERDARCRLLSMTDAFSVGCQLSESVRDRYGLVCYTIAEQAATFSCIIRSGEGKRAEIREYLKLLREEAGA